MNQITELEGLNGKTIEQTRVIHGDLWIKFTDNSFAVLTIGFMGNPYGYDSDWIKVSEYNYTKATEVLVDFGIVSREEYEITHQEELIEEERLAKEMNDKIEKDREEYERNQLEILRKKYES